MSLVISPDILETMQVERLLSSATNDEQAKDMMIEIPEAVVIRLRRLGEVTLSESHRYNFLLSGLHDANRLPGVRFVTSSTWRVFKHENKDNPLELAHHLEAEDKVASLRFSPEDKDELDIARSMFEWFDAHPEKHKSFKGERPRSKPNIFTSSGIEELVKEVLNG
jgi:hypothetical protein